MKSLTLCFICLFSWSAFAQHQHKAQPLVGVHGMASFEIDGGFYASHMPLANSIHAHQIVFSYSLDENQSLAMRALHEQYSLVTIVPEKFDLAKLMDKSLTQFKANVHANHFERGGQLKLEGVKVSVKKLLLVEPLKGGQGGYFYSLSLDDSTTLQFTKLRRGPALIKFY